MKTSTFCPTLQLANSSLLLKWQALNQEAIIIHDNNGRVRGYLNKKGKNGCQSIAIKGLPTYLAKENIEKAAKMLKSSYVKLQGNRLNVIPRGLGGIPPEENVPECFICPISHEIMETPVVTPCGHTFEKVQLLQWVNSGHSNCPTCQKDLTLNSSPNNWSINYAIKSQIDEWKQQKTEPVCPRALSKNPTPVDAAKSNLLLQLAKHYVEQKNYSDAIKQYEEAIKNTDNIEPYVEYVQLLLKADYPLKASKAFVYLARCYQKENNHKEVVNAYREAIQLQPENKDFLEEFARHLEKVEEKEEAVHCYETLIKISQKEEKSFLALAKYYKKLIELEPNELKHYEAYRTLLQANGQREEAKEIKKKILERQRITSSNPEKAILKKKIKKLKRQQATLEMEVIRLKASEQRLEAAMQTLEIRIVARVNTGLREQKWNEEKQRWINSFINAIPNEMEKKAVRNAVEILRKNDLNQTELDLKVSTIKAAGAQALAIALKDNQTLQQLNLFCNEIGITGARALAGALEGNQTLQQLNLFYNKIEATGAIAIARILEKNQSLQLLDLTHNQIDDAGTIAIAKVLEKNQSLQQLNLTHNRIDNAGAIAIAIALKANQTLQQLNLSSNKIGTEGGQAIAKALEKNQSLQHLNLTHNQIGAEGATAMAKALRKNLSLQSLALSSNKIGTEGAQAIAKALKKSQSLQHLNLACNSIDDKGIQALAVALQKNLSLQILDLTWNKMTATGVQTLTEVLKENESLQQLLLGKTHAVFSPFHHTNNGRLTYDVLITPRGPIQQLQIGDTGALMIAKAIENNQSLQQLNLSHNRIGITGVRALAKALEKNRSLQGLTLKRNEIDSAGALALAVALEKNQTLQQLNLAGNKIKDEGARALVQALEKNLSIQRLDLYSQFFHFPRKRFATINPTILARIQQLLQRNQQLH